MDKWIGIIVLGVLVIGMLAFYTVRQKRMQKESEQTMNSFQVGDKVVTHIGVYGRIKKIYNTSYGKVCVLEIGTNYKLDIEMDMRYIAGKDEKVLVTEDKSDVSKTVAPKTETEENTNHVNKVEEEKKADSTTATNETPKKTTRAKKSSK